MFNFLFWCSNVLRIVLALTYPVSDYILSFIYRLFMGEKKPLPAIENKLLLIPATELAEKIRKREVSSEEVVKAYISRSQEIHPCINAVTDERYEESLRDAIAVDQFLASTEKSEEQIAEETPLLGVPFTCKETLGVKDLLQTAGLLEAKGHRAKEDCAAAFLYRKAGAIPIAVTNVSELCMWWESANLLYGRTRNPYDNTRTSGGSSGGEAALITSAGSVIGIGRDGGGSIRTPAAFCGVYGHKSTGGNNVNKKGKERQSLVSCGKIVPNTYSREKRNSSSIAKGIVSNRGAFPPPVAHQNGVTPTSNIPQDQDKEERIVYHINTGPICRYASDLSLLLKVMSNHNSKIRWDEKVDFCKVKFYYMIDIPGIGNYPQPDIEKAVLKAVEHFERKYNVKATRLRFKEMANAFSIAYAKKSILPPSKQSTLCFWLEVLKKILRMSQQTLPRIYYWIVTNSIKNKFYHDCIEEFAELERKFAEVFQEDSILFFPTHPEPAPHYLMSIVKVVNSGYSAIFNVLNCPSTTIPAGLSNGLPIGLQAISGSFNDHLTIAAAIELEREVFHGWMCPGPINVWT